MDRPPLHFFASRPASAITYSHAERFVSTASVLKLALGGTRRVTHLPLSVSVRQTKATLGFAHSTTWAGRLRPPGFRFWHRLSYRHFSGARDSRFYLHRPPNTPPAAAALQNACAVFGLQPPPTNVAILYQASRVNITAAAILPPSYTSTIHAYRLVSRG